MNRTIMLVAVTAALSLGACERRTVSECTDPATGQVVTCPNAGPAHNTDGGPEQHK